MTASHHRKTPTQIIKRHLHEWIDNSTMTETTFATLVRERHEAVYPPGASTVEWSQQIDAGARMEADRRHVMRWFEKSSNARLPAEMYDVLVEVFPEDRRFALEEDLAAQRGGVFVFRPEVRGTGGLEQMGRMAKEASEAIAAVGKLYEDGVLNEKDAEIAPWAISEIDQAVVKLLEMRQEIEQKALGIDPETNESGAMVITLHGGN